jgi:antitoxin (DNA-binding transcriptional repressor) of toxin-antitoxin stability system
MRKKTDRRAVAAPSAAKNFGALVDRVRESGAVYEVESHGQVVAEIRPATRHFTVHDLNALFASRASAPAPAELLDAIEEARREARRQPASAAPALSGRGGRRRR